MDATQITGTATGAADVLLQGTQKRRHHHGSIADRVNAMEDAIDKAVKAGKLTDDQAAAMKKELDDVKQVLSSAQPGGSNQSNPVAQLSDDDRKKIFSELSDVRKKLYAALNPDGSDQAVSNNTLNNLFAAIDSNNDGSISKDEFADFLKNLAQNGGYNVQGATVQQTTVIQSTFSTTA